jgi:hypothetical protein
MVPEKPEPNAVWDKTHGWITGLPSVNDPEYSKELKHQINTKNKAIKAKKNRDASGPKLAEAMLTSPGLRNIYSDTNEEGDVILPGGGCGGGFRSGSFYHGTGNCGCTGC